PRRYWCLRADGWFWLWLWRCCWYRVGGQREFALGSVQIPGQLGRAGHPVDNAKDRNKGRARPCLYFTHTVERHDRQLARMTGDGGEVAIMQCVDCIPESKCRRHELPHVAAEVVGHFENDAEALLVVVGRRISMVLAE